MAVRHLAYGLTIECDRDLGLETSTGSPDVVVSEVNELEAPESFRDRVPFRVPSVMSFIAESGTSISYVPEPGASESSIRRAIVGAVMGVVLQQRGFLVLHASVVRIDDVAVGFTAESGAGKSTLAEAFLRSGFGVLSDDLAIIDTDSTGASVLPSIPTIRLRPGNCLIDDRFAPPGGGDFKAASKIDRPALEPSELAAIYFLEQGSSLGISPLHDAAAALRRLTEATRARTMLQADRAFAARHFHQCGVVITNCALATLTRTRSYDELPAVVDLVASHVRSL